MMRVPFGKPHGKFSAVVTAGPQSFVRSFQAARALGLLLFGGWFGVACGGSDTPPETPATHESDAARHARKSNKEEDVGGIPSGCMERMGACLPPIKWAEKVCHDVYPDLALYMFRKGTPFSRFYMVTGLNAVNGWGPTVSEELQPGEEVLVINHRLKKFSLEVEGSGGTYDVLRWNGGCVTLDVNEVTPQRPARPRHSKVNWRFLGDAMQKALRDDPEVVAAYRARRKECKGVTMGTVTGRCQELDARLGDVITEFVRRTPDLPVPEFHP